MTQYTDKSSSASCQGLHNELSYFHLLYCSKHIGQLMMTSHINSPCCSTSATILRILILFLLSPAVCPLRLIAVPLSKYLGVKDRIRIRAPSIPKLEAFYKQNSRQPSQVCIPSPPNSKLILWNTPEMIALNFKIIIILIKNHWFIEGLHGGVVVVSIVLSQQEDSHFES